MSDPDPTPGDGGDGGGDGGRADDPASGDAERSGAAGLAPDGDDARTRIERYVNYAVLAGLLLLAFVAVVQFYAAASAAIGTWVTYEYRAPFRAVFNLVVLLLAGLGVSVQLRRLRGGDEGESESAGRGSEP